MVIVGVLHHIYLFPNRPLCTTEYPLSIFNITRDSNFSFIHLVKKITTFRSYCILPLDI